MSSHQETSKATEQHQPVLITPETPDHHNRTDADSDLSHYLHYEDNNCFFPPSWLGKEPQRQLDDEAVHRSRGREGRLDAPHGAAR
ncbi:hypothetical protein ASPZODRAFT_134943 [Penicilliopsis zonata CBS 506.65]|uniref:Uncharacterized protein n=1 Tax=Penicilliopsis zonata CBS 506.65 TaxID=1073090 RepID=A0A1L9SC76_9EURO|nr:hypothetical protein ASPZODRAFT_134943 [Penicilliopsis zonata CBS 506.65]OJJ44805.1 hypothetical protein ASPZODRAFT_134943 [Penicilliopsis zonata CBS 506.65]